MAASTSNRMRVILGTMAIGGQASEPVSVQLIDLFEKRGYSELDTAIMYVNGKSEKTIGEILSEKEKPFQIATKANPWFDGTGTQTTPQGGLKGEMVKKQLNTSLESLKQKSVDLFYLHAPDHQTPLKETLQAVNELYKEGKFRLFGLSNFASWQVVQVYYICKAEGYVLPTVYQGMYNCLTRSIEAELLPALRTCGIRFYAYNPLAGGMLTGKYKYEDDPAEGRFRNDTIWGQRYRERFWNKSQFESLEILKQVCSEHSLSVTEVALRWIMHHSQLSKENEDGVILGASSVDHLSQNIDAVEKGPLPDQVLDAIEAAWQCSKPICPGYFR